MSTIIFLCLRLFSYVYDYRHRSGFRFGFLLPLNCSRTSPLMLSRPLMRRAIAVALRASLDSVASRLLGNQQQKNQTTKLSAGNIYFCLSDALICPQTRSSTLHWEKVPKKRKSPKKGQNKRN